MRRFGSLTTIAILVADFAFGLAALRCCAAVGAHCVGLTEPRATIGVGLTQITLRATARRGCAATDAIGGGNANPCTTLITILAHLTNCSGATLVVGHGARAEARAAIDPHFVGIAGAGAAICAPRAKFAVYSTAWQQLATVTFIETRVADLAATIGGRAAAFASHATSGRSRIGTPPVGAQVAATISVILTSLVQDCTQT